MIGSFVNSLTFLIQLNVCYVVSVDSEGLLSNLIVVHWEVRLHTWIGEFTFKLIANCLSLCKLALLKSIGLESYTTLSLLLSVRTDKTRVEHIRHILRHHMRLIEFLVCKSLLQQLIRLFPLCSKRIAGNSIADRIRCY